MRHILAAFLCAMAGFTASCARSTVRIGSFTDADWQALQKKAAILCEAFVEPDARDEDGEVPALRGDAVPEALRYLNPQRVWIRSRSVSVELWHTPAGDDTIHIDHGADGGWTITVHEGSYVNKERVAWSSKKEPNQSLEPTSVLGTSAAEQPLVPSTLVAHL